MTVLNMDRVLDGSWLAGLGFKPRLDQPRQQAIINFIAENKFNIGIFCVFVFLALRQFSAKNAAAKKAGATREFLDAPEFPEIERLGNFDWKQEEPIKLRLFKPKYYLTMGKFASTLPLSSDKRTRSSIIVPKNATTVYRRQNGVFV